MPPKKSENLIVFSNSQVRVGLSTVFLIFFVQIFVLIVALFSALYLGDFLALPKSMHALEAQIATLSQDFKAMMTNTNHFQSEMRTEMNHLQSEIRTEMASMKSDLLNRFEVAKIAQESRFNQVAFQIDKVFHLSLPKT